MTTIDEQLLMQGVQRAGTEQAEPEHHESTPVASSSYMLQDYVSCAREYGPAVSMHAEAYGPEPAGIQAMRDDLKERADVLVNTHGNDAVREAIRGRLAELVESYECLACGVPPPTHVTYGRSVTGYPVAMAEPMFEEAGLLLKLSKGIGDEEQKDHMIMLGKLYATDVLRFLSKAESKYNI